jgi:aldehyde:ferredoxin oxidoreductase
MGKLLNVNLATGSIEEESLDEELCRDYIGGYGLGAKLLYDRIPVGADPLGPDNVLALLTGPLTGTPAVIGSRFVAMAKSPKTSGGVGDANCGGFFGPYLKFAGFDGVMFEGIASKPVYLLIDEGKAELRDASDLWGLGVSPMEDILKQEGRGMLHRSGRRDDGPDRRHYERQGTRGRPLRVGCGDGLQEAKSSRGQGQDEGPYAR